MELRLDKKLYSLEAINQAIEAFGSFATIELDKGTKTDHLVTFKDVDPGIGEAITDEFANYTLGLTIEERGQ